jgi:ketosteroid isomerase-like protein
MSRGKQRQQVSDEQFETALSSTNVKLVRRSIDAWNSGDVQAWLETLDPGVRIWSPTPDADESPYRGHKGARKFVEALTRDWGNMCLRSESFHANADSVLAVGRLEARGKEHGLELTTPAAWLVRLRDRKIVGWRVYTDQNEALKAAGLRR